jgi:5-methylcytosine-specific restriction endonuclease McrBC GTP-binding regulatory subunit McrB
MTDKFEKNYTLWDEFIKVWPIERLATMSLDDYTMAGSKDSFTYWIESRLDSLGSIWGGSSFKFGVFSRRDTDTKESGEKLSYSDLYGWYSALGNSPEVAFERVRKCLCKIAEAAAKGDLQAVEAEDDLGEAYKWKVAFHYQDRANPVIVDIFKKAPLRIFCNASQKGLGMADLQTKALALRAQDEKILELGSRIWSEWTHKSQPIWKLSHGNGAFTVEERKILRENKLVVVHKDTAQKQGEKFQNSPIGTMFYLCHGNTPGNNIQLLGQFTSEASPSSKGEGWLQRSYKIIKESIKANAYSHSSKKWTPRGNSTFWKVGEDDLAEFETQLLLPYFGIDLGSVASQSDDIEESPEDNEPHPIKLTEHNNSRSAFNHIYYGPPGTGKTFKLHELLQDKYTDPEIGDCYEFVTFHQSYGYEEFVEGLRPILAEDKHQDVDDSESKATKEGQVHYKIKSGAFLRLCERARKNPTRQYAMVIDEINRGNISKIFGELITLIEVDKREGAKYPIAVTLPYSGESFSVPTNVDLIGTMNTADRSLALVDTALRRRFEFVESMPNPAVLNGILVTKDDVEIDIERLLETLNRRIEALYDRDHTIGHAYFTPLLDTDSSAHFDTLKAIFKNKIFPLLEEYFFEDWQKIRLVLGDNQKQKQYQFVQEISREEDLAELFGQEHELDQYAIRSRYQLNPDGLNEPKSYLGIYAPTE